MSPSNSSGLRPSRDAKGSSPLGTTIFLCLRALDPVVQYGILALAWGDPLIRLFGGTPLPLEGPPVALGLPAWRLILFGMAVAGSQKGAYYLLAVQESVMPMKTALFVGIFKAISTTVNSLLFCAATTSPAKHHLTGGKASYGQSQPLPPMLALSCGIFVVGMTIEVVSELQRKAFKSVSANRGKPFVGGLFSYARHINYGGYTIWKTGYGLASAGWWWAALTFLWLFGEFRRRSIPEVDAYCQKRYGDAWTHFKKRTSHKLIPFIY